MEDLNVDENVHTIPLWRIVVSIFGLIIILLLSTAIVCGTNAVCRSNIPTLGALLDSPLIAPFIVTAMNSVLSLHLFVSMGIYYMTENNGYIVARVQMVSSILVYVSIVVTLFVFPFTSWDRNWANMTIIVALAFWMLNVILCLRKHYKYKANAKRRLVNVQIGICVLYVLLSIAYVILRALPLSGYLFFVEVGSGLSILTFLTICIAHLWSMSITIDVE